MKRRTPVITALVLLAMITLSFSACSRASDGTESTQSGTGTVVTTSFTTPAGDSEVITGDFSQVVRDVRPSVVAIDIEATTYDFFNQPQTVQGAGSGWIIDAENGYIVTNNHVVEGANTVTITLYDGRVFPAEDVKTDTQTDLAVVKINADNLTPAPTGDITNVEIGDWVLAIGNSLGLGISATVGVVSALDVSLQESPGNTLHGLIQTDAAINPGNSGGPLVNASGEVVGINSVKVSQVGVEGMGYSISIDEALPIIRTLIEVGYVTRPWLGINAVTMTDVIAARYGLAANTGVLLTDIVSGGPADQAGLEAGDIVTAIDGKDLERVSDLVDEVNSHDIGQTITVTYWHSDSKADVTIVLVKSPQP